MDPIIIGLIAGAAFLATRKPKKKKRPTENLPSGDYQIAIGEEFSLLLPRETGYWTETSITGGDVDVFNKAGDPLTLGRVRGATPGAVKVQYFADPDKTDLVGEYMFQVAGTASQRQAGATATLARK